MEIELIKWEPVANLGSRYYIDDILDLEEGFIVFLKESHTDAHVIKITFEDSVISYRKTIESMQFKILDEIIEQYGSELHKSWSLFKYVKSPYIEWLIEQSYGIGNSYNLTHYFILGSDSTLDIIATYEPKVEIIQNKPSK
jgi:hypothetical protein